VRAGVEQTGEDHGDGDGAVMEEKTARKRKEGRG